MAGRDAATVRRGQELNLPLVARVIGAPPADALRRLSFVSLDADNVDLTCIKRSEDGSSLILRFVETAGAATPVSVTLPKAISAAAEVNLLEDEIGAAQFDGARLRFEIGAYEVRSFKLSLD